MMIELGARDGFLLVLLRIDNNPPLQTVVLAFTPGRGKVVSDNVCHYSLGSPRIF